MGSLRDREVACSASDRQGSNFESCVWRTVSSQSSHHPQEVLLAQFSLYVHKGGLKPDSFHFILLPNTYYLVNWNGNVIHHCLIHLHLWILPIFIRKLILTVLSKKYRIIILHYFNSNHIMCYLYYKALATKKIKYNYIIIIYSQ